MSLHLLPNPNTMATHPQNGSTTSNGSRHAPFHPISWLDLRVFYIRIIKCDITNETTPEHLTLNHVPLTRDTLLEVNNIRTSIYSGATTLLRRDRIDKKAEEVTFVSTDSVRTTGSVKFEVFDNDVLLVSGVFDLCDSNGPLESNESNGYVSNGYGSKGCGSNGCDLRWRMEFETDVVVGKGFLKGKGCDVAAIEVCCAGSFGGKPIILTKTLRVGCRKKKGVLEAIPEDESMASGEGEGSSSRALKVQEYRNYPPQQHEHRSLYSGLEYIENEDGELSWFNAGVRVGVGIGLSVCLGMGIGVGLLVRTYQRTTRNFTRRLL